MGMIEKIKQIDLFGSPIQLRFEKQSKNKTTLGGLYSVLLYTAIIYSLAIEIIQIIEKQSPHLIQIEEVVENKEQILLTAKNINLKFQLRQNYDGNINEEIQFDKIYTATVQFNLYQKDPSINSIIVKSFPLQIINCDDQNSFYCISPQSLEKLEQDMVEQEFFESDYSEIQILLQQCTGNNLNDEIECLPLEQIDQELQYATLSLECEDQIFNGKSQQNFNSFPLLFFNFLCLVLDFKVPFQSYKRRINSETRGGFKKQTSFLFQKYSLETDTGFYFQDQFTVDNRIISRIQDQIVLPDSNESQGVFHEILIGYDGVLQETHKRSYNQLQDIFANIGGILKILLLVGNFFCKPISKLDMREKLVNRLFKFKVGNELQNEFDFDDHRIQKFQSHLDIDIKEQGRFELNQSMHILDLNKQPMSGDISPAKHMSLIKLEKDVRLQQNRKGSELANQIIEDMANVRKLEKLNSLQNISHNKNNRKEDPNHIRRQKVFESIFNFTKRVIQMSQIDQILYYVFPFFSQIKQKKALLDFAYKSVSMHLDTNYIMKKLQEIDQIKLLLFNQDQLHLFEYMPPPVIDTDVFFKMESQTRPRSQTPVIQNESMELEFVTQNRVNQAFFDNRSELQRATDAFNSLQNIQIKEVYCEMDEKLVCFLDPIILDIFKQDRKMAGMKLGSNSPINMNLDSKHEFFNLQEQKDNSPKKRQMTFSSFGDFVNHYNNKSQNVDEVQEEEVANNNNNNNNRKKKSMSKARTLQDILPKSNETASNDSPQILQPIKLIQLQSNIKPQTSKSERIIRVDGNKKSSFYTPPKVKQFGSDNNLGIDEIHFPQFSFEDEEQESPRKISTYISPSMKNIIINTK